MLINLQVADLSGRAYWYPIPPPWDATDQDLSSQVQSESGTFEPGESFTTTLVIALEMGFVANPPTTHKQLSRVYYFVVAL